MEEKPDLITVLEKAGIDTNRAYGRKQFMVRCPFHDDQGKPNMAVWVATQTWRCFRCGIGGDVFDFVGRQLFGAGWNNRDTKQFIEVLGKLDVMAIPKVKPQPMIQRTPEINRTIMHVLTLASRAYHLALLGPAGCDAREYLESRLVDRKTIISLRLGLAHPGVLSAALAGHEQKAFDAAEEAGLFHDGREWLANRVIFPDLRQGDVLTLSGRDQRPESDYRYLSLPGLPKTLYRLAACRKDKPVILTESMMDVVSMWQLGFQGVGAMGTGIAYYLYPGIRKFPVVAILPQRDQAGQEAVEMWKKEIPHARMLNFPYSTDLTDKEKDFNKFCTNHGLKAGREALLAALADVGIEMTE